MINGRPTPKFALVTFASLQKMNVAGLDAILDDALSGGWVKMVDAMGPNTKAEKIALIVGLIEKWRNAPRGDDGRPVPQNVATAGSATETDAFNDWLASLPPIDPDTLLA